MAKVSSKVPRGFTRYYVLYLLSDTPLTGKEIIKEAEARSDGVWSPSPGLIYPLLGRLLDDGLIMEMGEGRFICTSKGRRALLSHYDFQEHLDQQLKMVQKLGVSMFTTGKFLAEEAVYRISSVVESVKKRASESSNELQERFNSRYKNFLEGELERLKAKDE
jgi:DNA-binding PadR family transcriptional regulator